MNIALIGARAAGKTTVCRLLAKKLDKKLVSAEDEILKKTKMSAPGFIKDNSLSSYYDIECEIIERISDFDDCVFDTTHSIVMRNENIINLKKNSIVVLLTADMKTIANRLKTKKQDFGKDGDSLQHEAYESRFRNAADYAIDTSGLSPEEICDLISHYILTEIR